MKNLNLFLVFSKIGLFTFGGGISMIPLIEIETVTKRNWITDEELLDIIAIAESTPGVIAVNSATYIGYKVNGFWGALCATLGVITPSFVIILIISLFIDKFLQNKYFANAFKGIRACVGVLILSAAYKLFKKCSKDILFLVFILATVVIGILFTSISTIYIIIGGFILGLLGYTLINYYKKGAHK